MSKQKKAPKRIRTGLKASGPILQHGVRVRTGVKAGGAKFNHGVQVRQASR
jgi:hypothetical protein